MFKWIVINFIDFWFERWFAAEPNKVEVSNKIISTKKELEAKDRLESFINYEHYHNLCQNWFIISFIISS
jgi:hypothetical protein